MPHGAAKKKRNTAEADGQGDYPHVGRTLEVLEYLAIGPHTTEELAEKCATSTRTMVRFMAALGRAKAPVYIRRAPGRGPSKWALDLDKFLVRFQKNGDGA